MFKQFNVVIQTLILTTMIDILFQFIHSKGLFWPRNRLPSCRKITVGLNKSVEVKFKIDSTQKIARDQEKCVEASEDYDWNNCVLHYVFKKVGCSLNWFVDFSLPNCTSRQQIQELMSHFKKIKRMPMPKLSQKSGCYSRCSKRRFTILEVKETDLVWETDWVSEVVIGLGFATFEKRTEYYIYDLVKGAYNVERILINDFMQGDLLGDIGGYLGMFLGWSCLSVLTNFMLVSVNLKSKLCLKTKP